MISASVLKYLRKRSISKKIAIKAYFCIELNTIRLYCFEVVLNCDILSVSNSRACTKKAINFCHCSFFRQQSFIILANEELIHLMTLHWTLSSVSYFSWKGIFSKGMKLHLILKQRNIKEHGFFYAHNNAIKHNLEQHIWEACIIRIVLAH